MMNAPNNGQLSGRGNVGHSSDHSTPTTKIPSPVSPTNVNRFAPSQAAQRWPAAATQPGKPLISPDPRCGAGLAQNMPDWMMPRAK